jgi:hypothetical protein
VSLFNIKAGWFAGADIYVMGAAIVPETGRMVYRDPKQSVHYKIFGPHILASQTEV